MLPEKEWKVGDKVMVVAPSTSHVTVGTITDTSDWSVIEPGLVYIFITKMGATYGFPPEIVFPFNSEDPQLAKERTMAGYDRIILEDKLTKMGWTVCLTADGKDAMIPPTSLFENMPKHFHVYDARDLQNILGESVAEE